MSHIMREDWGECSLVEGCDIHDNLRKPINSKERNERINRKNEDQLFPYYGATGQVGFIAYDWIRENNPLDREEKEFLKNKTFYGNEIVANTRRMCLMNMYLHNIGEIDGDTPIKSADALVADDGTRVDYVLANPPFGKKSSMTITNEAGEAEKQDMSYNRQDFPVDGVSILMMTSWRETKPASTFFGLKIKV